MSTAFVEMTGPVPVYSAPPVASMRGGRVQREQSEADRLVTELYSAHYTNFVRLATLLLRNHASQQARRRQQRQEKQGNKQSTSHK